MSLTRWNKLSKGIRFRLTLVYSALFGLFLTAFTYIITNQNFQSWRKDFDSSLINYAIDLSEHLKIDPSGLNVGLKVPHSEIKKNFPFVLSQTFYTVRDIKGKILIDNFKDAPFKDIHYDPSLATQQDYTHRLLSFKIKKDKFRAVNLKVTTSLGKEMILQVATNYNFISDREKNHLIITFMTVPFLILFSSIMSFMMAGSALNPIRGLTETANNIAAQNLSLRVPEVTTGDEVEELARTLNTLLERLEKSFIAQENFVSNASHQLNTPLAIIKGELDVLESKERSSEEITKFHQSLREELERMIELVKNMLLVSRVKSGLGSFIFHPLRLDELLLSASTRLSLRAKEKKIIIKFNIDEELNSTDLEVMGEKQLLEAVFENILDNAIKYSPEESCIDIRLKRRDGNTEVYIQDEGPGLEESKFQQIIKNRFQRGNELIPGTGIGLFIANKIASFHFAEISCQKSHPKGSVFKIMFQKNKTKD